ncbi:sulfatase [Pontibacter sp. G13]|uniref:sulfatase n=1 Tax=Pontibacter sp. G13 TaxID=3074898 RepID=UPI0028891D9E|nr:sulfatase [Pontibacter sp. G13]WNJ19487.1 sulfatase [Pontibacter sp. G13]
MWNYLKGFLALIILLGWQGDIVCLLAQSSPNIIFILSDDAGYADFGFQGSEMMITPRLDRLAQSGVVFEQAYVTAAVCGPSRAGILTGRYQQRFGFEENNVPGIMDHYLQTDDDMGLPLDQVTMADYLKAQGYRTALFGKWHQGNADRFHPTFRGFDEFLGFRGGARSYFPFTADHPASRQEDWLERGYRKFGESDGYLADVLVDETIQFVERNQEQPFFVFLSFNSVHSPMDALPEDLAQFPELTGKRKKLAAMTLALDRACGRLLDKLDELGMTEHTLVVFTNDNGGPTDSNASDNSPLSGTKANHLEGGIRVPFIMRWPAAIEGGKRFAPPVSTFDLLPTFLTAAGGNPDTLTHLDGVDLIPFLNGQEEGIPHDTLFWKKENRGAVRAGDWKLLRFPDRPAELYHVVNDPGEMHNLASEHPDKVRQLYKALFRWEVTLARPKWQLERRFEGKAMKRMDRYWDRVEDQ